MFVPWKTLYISFAGMIFYFTFTKYKDEIIIYFNFYLISNFVLMLDIWFILV